VDERDNESESLPAVILPGDRAIEVHDDLERLRREVAPPAIVRDAGPHAEYAYADFFKANGIEGHAQSLGQFG
jgi:integrase/recombinase XerD